MRAAEFGQSMIKKYLLLHYKKKVLLYCYLGIYCFGQYLCHNDDAIAKLVFTVTWKVIPPPTPPPPTWDFS